jgi:hypothetical protein
LSISLSHNNNQQLHLALFYLAIIISSCINFTDLNFVTDAYYYFALSRNIVAGQGLTFDGVSITTGVHPLWLAVTTLIYYLTSNAAIFHTVIFFIVSLLILGAHFLLSRVAIATGISLNTFTLISIPVFLVNLSLLGSGTENTLLLFLISLFLWLHYQDHQPGPAHCITLGVVLLLIYFCRLDNIFLVAVYLPWFTARYWYLYQTRTLIFSGVIIVAILAHWLLMYSFFGTIFSTSQISIKGYLCKEVSSNLIQAFAPYHHILSARVREFIGAISGQPLITAAPSLDRYLGLVVPLTLIVTLVSTARKDLSIRFPILLIGLTYALQLSYYAVEMNGWMQVWYDTTWIIAILFGAGFFFTSIRYNPPARAITIVLCLSCALVIGANAKRTQVSWITHAKESQLLANFDNGTNVLVGWSPDRAVYHSQVSIRHLEGLMNGYDYVQSYLLKHRIASYLKEIKATHYVISNPSTLPPHLPCYMNVASDSDRQHFAYGIYDNHNSYIAVYRIVHLNEKSTIPVLPNDECRSDSHLNLRPL